MIFIIKMSTRKTTDMKFPVKSDGTKDMRTTSTNKRK
jgi:hypothetical protein